MNGYLDELEKVAWQFPSGLLSKAQRFKTSAQDHRRGLALAALAGAAGIGMAGKVQPPDKRKLLRPVEEGTAFLEKDAALRRRPYGMNPIVNLRPHIRLRQGRLSEKLHLLTAYLSREI